MFEREKTLRLNFSTIHGFGLDDPDDLAQFLCRASCLGFQFRG
jgi:hypothetical protein